MLEIQDSLERLSKQYHELTRNKNRDVTQEFAVRCKQREINMLCQVNFFKRIFLKLHMKNILNSFQF